MASIMEYGSARPRVRALSSHARYRCRDSGACCEAHWPIPIEADRLVRLSAALGAGHVHPAIENRPALQFPEHATTEAPALMGTDGAVCVFRNATSCRCHIHAALGHDALPLSCRQFPRVTVLAPGVVSVTLSHYCPTAANLLNADDPVAVVSDPPAFPADGEYVGLDARDALPPLLCPDMAMDWPAWWAWEACAVGLLGRMDLPVDDALQALASAVESTRRWKPSDGDLTQTIRRTFSGPLSTRSSSPQPGRETLVRAVLTAIPSDIRPGPIVRHAVPSEHVRRRYLAAHAFANWTAYLGLGLRAWLRSLHAADALIGSGLGVGQADLWLRHLADPHALTAAWNAAEKNA